MSDFKKKISNFIPAIIVFVSIIIIFLFVLLCSGVPSASMDSTIKKGTFIISNRLPAFFSNPDRGDVVVFRSEEKGEDLVKRVIGVGGDKISLKDDKVYVNGEPLDEPYITGKTKPDKQTEYFVPEGHFFALGDNREDSNDSRSFENPYIEYDAIRGYVFLNISLGGDNGFFIHGVS